uniref:Uncharacterized protein n=1 Tax=Anguilla anguilla TaxID=7936 RepID=A0A0E9XPH0_ANGAN
MSSHSSSGTLNSLDPDVKKMVSSHTATLKGLMSLQPVSSVVMVSLIRPFRITLLILKLLLSAITMSRLGNRLMPVMFS